jgi:hypothetical protein
MRYPLKQLAPLALIVCALAGCASIGPGTIARDRLDYDQAVTTSWKRTMLLNLVKMRYGDTPMFMDVSSIINSYSLESEVSLGANWETGFEPVDSKSLGASGRYADKPTITYNPLVGERFTRSLMTPISPSVVVSLIQSGWSADRIMQILVSSANGLQNRYGAGARSRGADPEFYELGAAIRQVQSSGAVGMRIEKDGNSDLTMMVLEQKQMTPAVKQDVHKVRDLLGIQRDDTAIKVVYGSAAANQHELAMVTRSMLEILMDIASTIEVPQLHVDNGTVLNTKVFDTDAVVGYKAPIRIQSSKERPANAFVSVLYEGYWFWIDNRDHPSKSLFSFLMIIFSLTDTGPAKGQPVITIPAG